MNYLRNLFHRPSPLSYAIAGLGNPTPKYRHTRHNAGFMALDLLARQNDISLEKRKFQSLLGDGLISSKRCLLLKPQTFMNCSGEAVEAARAYYKLQSKQILVLVDDIYLPFGKIRIRRKGSAGGHNGIRSVAEEMGEEDFIRIKIGVGQKPESYNLADWVLKKLTPAEQEALQEGCAAAAAAVQILLEQGLDQAMNSFNGK